MSYTYTAKLVVGLPEKTLMNDNPNCGEMLSEMVDDEQISHFPKDESYGYAITNLKSLDSMVAEIQHKTEKFVEIFGLEPKIFTTVYIY